MIRNAKLTAVFFFLLTSLFLGHQQVIFAQSVYDLTLLSEPVEGGVLQGAGSYEAGETIAIDAVAQEGFKFISWTNEDGDMVSAEASFSFVMPAHDTTFIAHFVCTPAWTEVANLQYNMQIVGRVRLDQVVVTDSNVVVGAFVGDECRGIASPIPAFGGLIFMTVSSNVASGELVTLKIWNPEFCESCTAVQAFTFENQLQLGTLDEPYIIECLNEITLDLNFNQSYTWFSINVVQYDMSPNVLLADLQPCYNDRIIGQHAFAVYSGTEWVGSLTELSPQEMYRMRLCSAQSISLTANQAPNDAISLLAGSTWLGYRPNECMSVNSALANLTPTPAYNDRILGQNAFALYNGNQWIGSLTQLCPGKGYIMKLTNNSTLTYPAAGKINDHQSLTDSPVLSDSLFPKQDFAYGMMVVAQLPMEENLVSTATIYAYIGDELCGISRPDPKSDHLIFMHIGSDKNQLDEVHFKVSFGEDKIQLAVKEKLNFQSTAAVGDLKAPLLLHLKTE